jgi:hypothetical protein
MATQNQTGQHQPTRAYLADAADELNYARETLGAEGVPYREEQALQALREARKTLELCERRILRVLEARHGARFE